MKRFLHIMAVVVSMMFPAVVRAEESQGSEIQVDDPIYVAKIFVAATFVANAFDDVKELLVMREMVKSVSDSVEVIRKNDKNKLFQKKPTAVYADTLISDSSGENRRIYLVYVMLDYGEYGAKVFYVGILKYLEQKYCEVVALHELNLAEIKELSKILEERSKQ
jgi:hypothetical protein